MAVVHYAGSLTTSASTRNDLLVLHCKPQHPVITRQRIMGSRRLLACDADRPPVTLTYAPRSVWTRSLKLTLRSAGQVQSLLKVAVSSSGHGMYQALLQHHVASDHADGLDACDAAGFSVRCGDHMQHLACASYLRASALGSSPHCGQLAMILSQFLHRRAPACC